MMEVTNSLDSTAVHWLPFHESRQHVTYQHFPAHPACLWLWLHHSALFHFDQSGPQNFLLASTPLHQAVGRGSDLSDRDPRW